MSNWDEQYRNERNGGPPPHGPLTGGYWQGKADRERAEWRKYNEEWAKSLRRPSARPHRAPEARRPKRTRRPSARELRRRANPPPEYAGLRKASNVLAGVMFVILAAGVSYESFVSGYTLDEKIVVPLVSGLLGAIVGKTPLMLVRWGLRAIWDPPA